MKDLFAQVSLLMKKPTAKNCFFTDMP